MAKFITLEGIEGVGKTTCLPFMVEFLTKHKINHITTREPGGTEISESIRQVLLCHYQERMASDTELLLLFAGRAQHIATKIKPALSNNTWVISDRFTDATYAYQGAGRGISQDRIQTLEEWVQGSLRPDRIFLFDAPLETTLSRLQVRISRDRIESEQVEFFKRTKECYLQRAAQFPTIYRVIDASGSLNEIRSRLHEELATLIAEYK